MIAGSCPVPSGRRRRRAPGSLGAGLLQGPRRRTREGRRDRRHARRAARRRRARSADDALTDFYKQRLLVPQVNPNTLARLPREGRRRRSRATWRSSCARSRSSLDADNNLTVAMSDPSDRHAVDEIAFFTGAYVVRAVATQMQIAWCLAHYYGHVTRARPAAAASRRRRARRRREAGPRRRAPRGMTGRGRGDAPSRRSCPVDANRSTTRTTSRQIRSAAGSRRPRPRARAACRARSACRQRRAPSIRPPLPEDRPIACPTIPIRAERPGRSPSRRARSTTTDEPGDTIEVDVAADQSRCRVPKRKRPAEPDPPELAARAGEVQLATGTADRSDRLRRARDHHRRRLPRSRSSPRARRRDSTAEMQSPHRSEPFKTASCRRASSRRRTSRVRRACPSSRSKTPSRCCSTSARPQRSASTDARRDQRGAARRRSTTRPTSSCSRRARRRRRHRRSAHRNTVVGIGAVTARRAPAPSTAPRRPKSSTTCRPPHAPRSTTIRRASTRSRCRPADDDTTDEHVAAPPRPAAATTRARSRSSPRRAAPRRRRAASSASTPCAAHRRARGRRRRRRDRRQPSRCRRQADDGDVRARARRGHPGRRLAGDSRAPRAKPRGKID